MQILRLAAASAAVALGAAPAAAGALVIEGDIRSSDRDAPTLTADPTAVFAVSVAPPATGFECALGAAPLVPCTSPVTLSGLADTLHEFRVRAIGPDGPGPVESRYWRVDTTGPLGMELVSPAVGEILGGAAVRFAWTRPPDAARYLLRVNGGADREVGSPPAGAVATASALTFPDGDHTWSVVALDDLGNRSQVATGRFTVAEPPTARLSVPPGAGLSTRAVTLSSASDDNGPGPLVHEWDLDGDGRFETFTGTLGTVTRRLPAGDRRVGLRVTDTGGRAGSVSATLTVLPGPPPGRVGVTIAGGARFVRSLDVELGLVWPEFARAAVIGDEGFGPRRAIPVRPSVRWRLAPGLDGPRTVLARFPRAGAPTRVFRDEVVVDRSLPSVERIPTPTGWAVRATDETSGVDALQVSLGGRLGPWTEFGTPAAGRAIGRGERVRVRDRAGNVSRWLRLR